ncbi:hypothetical protein NUH88_01245 [Nisaea acidiphila]|uniref:Uncharacterized protein n=1 Tax=Nisaea acidiphila TaxID=1862145 RepID=A0A9J7AY21_9PROT|nr:hypothetical protein [Nisaea acidiphila]UUX50325.1 hypothetical protein NUH88_01245 [Nisaea acidiphila]
MRKPITDGAEVSIEFPDKAYLGYFRRDSTFEVSRDDDSIVLKLVHPGDDKRVASFHLHDYLLADVLQAIAGTLGDAEIGGPQREALEQAAKTLVSALKHSS